MKFIFSDDVDIKKNQEIVESLNLHEVIRNIVNNGNPKSNKGGRVEWESCQISYEPLAEGAMIRDGRLGQIKILDGDILYESVSCKDQKKGMLSAMLWDNGRYTKQFRMGKWVDRLLKYS